MSIVLKTILMIPVMTVGAYIYATALISVGRRTSKDRPKVVGSLAGTLVWLVYIPFLLFPFFCLMLTEISVVEGEEVWPVVKMLVPVLISYLLMITPGFYYIYKYRISELRKYGYFVSST